MSKIYLNKKQSSWKPSYNKKKKTNIVPVVDIPIQTKIDTNDDSQKELIGYRKPQPRDMIDNVMRTYENKRTHIPTYPQNNDIKGNKIISHYQIPRQIKSKNELIASPIQRMQIQNTSNNNDVTFIQRYEVEKYKAVGDIIAGEDTLRNTQRADQMIQDLQGGKSIDNPSQPIKAYKGEFVHKDDITTNDEDADITGDYMNEGEIKGDEDYNYDVNNVQEMRVITDGHHRFVAHIEVNKKPPKIKDDNQYAVAGYEWTNISGNNNDSKQNLANQSEKQNLFETMDFSQPFFGNNSSQNLGSQNEEKNPFQQMDFSQPFFGNNSSQNLDNNQLQQNLPNDWNDLTPTDRMKWALDNLFKKPNFNI